MKHRSATGAPFIRFTIPVAFKYIVIIILAWILCRSGIGSGASPTANHKPMWPHYNVSHSRVIAFKTKCSCSKGRNARRQKLHRDVEFFSLKVSFCFLVVVFFAIQVTGRLSIYVMIMKRSRGGCSPAEVWLDFFSFLFWNLHVFHAKLRMDLLAGQTRVCVTWRNPAATFQTLKMKRRKIYRGDPLFLSFFCPFTSFVSLTHTHTHTLPPSLFLSPLSLIV